MVRFGPKPFNDRKVAVLIFICHVRLREVTWSSQGPTVPATLLSCTRFSLKGSSTVKFIPFTWDTAVPNPSS